MFLKKRSPPIIIRLTRIVMTVAMIRNPMYKPVRQFRPSMPGPLTSYVNLEFNFNVTGCAWGVRRT